MLNDKFIEEMHARLLAAKEEMTEQLKSLVPHTEIGSEEDENAQEFEMDSVNSELAESIRHDLQKIETALLKIEQGAYGLDEDGLEIPEARLRALPWADSNVETNE